MKIEIGPYVSTQTDVRVENIHIDNYDIWNLDNTLAKIILPMLILLKATKHGTPLIDDEDVPDELKSTSVSKPLNEFDLDANYHLRWTWVLDEEIWAFSQIADDNSDIQFYVGGFNRDGHQAHHDRIIRGTTLFGKYFQTLWD